MRKFAKIMAVLLALSLATPCFAKGKVVTKWSLSNNDGDTMYLTFYNDGTAEMSTTADDKVTVTAYTGDTRKDGAITVDGGTLEIRGDRLFMGTIVFTKVKK